MRNKKMIIIYMCAICLILTSMLGLTYGYFNLRIEGNESSKNMGAISQVLKMEFTDGNESLTSTLEGYFNPGSILTKTFTFKNTGNKDLNYNIIIDELNNNFVRNDITYELYMNDNLLDCPVYNIDSETSKCLLPKENPAYLATNLNIEINETQSFKIVITYNESEENQIVDSGKTIGGSISAELGTGRNDLIIYGNIEEKLLPEEYQQVEYIEAKGEQYIELDYIASNITNSKGTYQITTTDYGVMLFGSRTSATANAYSLNWGGGTPYKYYNTFYESYNNGITTTEIDTKKHTFEKRGADLYIDGNVISSRNDTYVQKEFTTPYKMIVFGSNTNGTIGLFAHAKIYNLEFYDNDILKISLIPCYRKSDNIIGMYDTVENKFYTNKGTGSFEKGLDILNNEISGVGDKNTNYETNGYKIPINLSYSLDQLSFKKNYYIDSNNEEIKLNTYKYTEEYIPVIPNTEYTLYFENGNSSEAFVTIPLYDKNKNFISRIQGLDNFASLPKKVKITTPENCYFIKISIPNFDYKIKLTATKNIYIDEPLRELNNYSDYIDFGNQKIVRNVYSEQIRDILNKSSLSGTYSIFLSEITKQPLVTSDSTGYAYSNRFNQYIGSYGNLVNNPKSIQSYITSSSKNTVAFTFEDSSINSIEKALEEIDGGFEIIYVLNEKIIENVELPNIPIIKGITTIEINTEIKPSKIIY